LVNDDVEMLGVDPDEEVLVELGVEVVLGAELDFELELEELPQPAITAAAISAGMKTRVPRTDIELLSSRRVPASRNLSKIAFLRFLRQHARQTSHTALLLSTFVNRAKTFLRLGREGTVWSRPKLR
jgi:hypothetical protein